MVAEGGVVMAIVGHHTTKPVLSGGRITHDTMEYLEGRRGQDRGEGEGKREREREGGGGEIHVHVHDCFLCFHVTVYTRWNASSVHTMYSGCLLIT